MGSRGVDVHYLLPGICLEFSVQVCLVDALHGKGNAVGQEEEEGVLEQEPRHHQGVGLGCHQCSNAMTVQLIRMLQTDISRAWFESIEMDYLGHWASTQATNLVGNVR